MDVIAATKFEYRYRYLIHFLFYTLGFSAFWDKQPWRIGHNSAWLRTAEYLNRFGIESGISFRIVLLIAITFSTLAALLRFWAAAYLGASVVQRSSLHADRVVVDGPYRYMRNPLSIGMLLSTFALTSLMQLPGAAFVLVMVTLFEWRLVACEERYLRQSLGPIYDEYCRYVPRVLPRLRSHMPHGNTLPDWKQAFLSEVYFLGAALSFLLLGWKYDAPLILQGILVSLGAALIARSFIPNRN